MDFHAKLRERLEPGEALAVCTIVASRGSVPRRVGTKMIVREDGSLDFTLGGVPFEALVIEDARAAIRSDECGLKAYRFLPAGENATGMTCGGDVEVFFERVARGSRDVGHDGTVLLE